VAYTCPLRFHFIPTSLGVVLFDAVALKEMGVVAWIAGFVIYGLALRAMGDSWRMGIDREAPGVLVTHGIITWS